MLKNLICYLNVNFLNSRNLSWWFEVESVVFNYEDWITERGESNSNNQMPIHCEGERKIEGYQSLIGEDATIGSFIEKMKQQGKYHWDLLYEVERVNQWVKSGYQACL